MYNLFLLRARSPESFLLECSYHCYYLEPHHKDIWLMISKSLFRNILGLNLIVYYAWSRNPGQQLLQSGKLSSLSRPKNWCLVIPRCIPLCHLQTKCSKTSGAWLSGLSERTQLNLSMNTGTVAVIMTGIKILTWCDCSPRGSDVRDQNVLIEVCCAANSTRESRDRHWGRCRSRWVTDMRWGWIDLWVTSLMVKD